VLTLEEKARIRDHLAYLNTSPAASIQLGFPRASQAQFLVEMAMDRILPEAETQVVRAHLVECDRALADIAKARGRLKARKLGELELNPDKELFMLRREYDWWRAKLADSLGVPRNAYSETFGLPFNIPVAHDA
jgi:hypothetical protein